MPSTKHHNEGLFITLLEFESIYSEMHPATQFIRNLFFRCVSENRIKVFFPYTGVLQIKFDPFSDHSDVADTYCYSGHLEILDYQYGAELEGCITTSAVFPYKIQDLLQISGTCSPADLTNLDQFHFLPQLDSASSPIWPYSLSTYVFTDDLCIASENLQDAINEVSQLETDVIERGNSEGRYSVDYAARLFSLRTGASFREILKMLFLSISKGKLPAYPPGKQFPCMEFPDEGQINLNIGRFLLHELYADDLNRWRDENFIPKSSISFHTPPKDTVGSIQPVMYTECTYWKHHARIIADSITKAKPQLNIEQISEKVHEEMGKRHLKGEKGMTGRGGKVPSASNIKRNALTGIRK